jgi:hypothetical protein
MIIWQIKEIILDNKIAKWLTLCNKKPTSEISEMEICHDTFLKFQIDSCDRP